MQSPALARFPWLTKAQAYEFGNREFFGFDAREFPAFRRGEQGFVAINRKGKECPIELPLRRAYMDDGEVKLTAVVQIDFGLLMPEGGTEAELLDRLRTDNDLRNKIARRIESIVKFADSFADKQVGWIDGDRSISLSDTLESVRTRGLGKRK